MRHETGTQCRMAFQWSRSWPLEACGVVSQVLAADSRDDSSVRYARPTNGRRLPIEPVLASWDRAGTPSQTRSAEFLAALTKWLGPLPATPLALDLVVGLSAETPLASGGHDLDNYLYPVAQHLGHERFVAVFARKTHS